MPKAIEKVGVVGYAIACMSFDTLEQSKKYLDQFIQPAGGAGSGAHNFARMKQFMDLLGNPQNKLNVVHVAGTSGKGSTCYVISSLLQAYGFKVGLTVSPHMLDLRERTQINNQLLSEVVYGGYLTALVPAIEQMKRTKWGAPSFFEITMAHAFYTFYKEKVDYAVIETGLGGRYDASNVVSRQDKLAVITSIGLDHIDFLGDTLAKIAEEKAHIIQKGNRVLSVPQVPEVQGVIERVSREKQASLKYIEINYDIKTSLRGEYQHENVSLALAALYELSKRDGFSYDSALTSDTLQHLHVLGRFDVKQLGNKTVIIDGAHNPQKMAAFIHSLTKEYPDQKFPFLIAFSKTKDASGMLDEIIPLANKIIITTFGKGTQGMHIQYQGPENIKMELQKKGFHDITIVPDNLLAWKSFIAENSSVGVTTGSLYLLSDIYSYALNT